MPSATDWAQYIAVRGACALLEPFPPTQSLQSARGVASLYAALSPQRVERARLNIARSFPEMAEGTTREVALDSVRHMFELFIVDALAMTKIVHEWSWQRYVHFGDFEEALELMLSDKPCILLTGHIGNWEFLGYVLSLVGFGMTALARPLDNPLVSDWLFAARRSSGLRVITKWGATEEMQRLMTHGGKLAFVADQNAGDDGMFVPFFGRLASSYKSIGLLAMRYRVPIVVGMARRIHERFEYKFLGGDVIRPEDWEGRDDPLFYITARFNRALEMLVRGAPEQYLWIHRRWKSRPKHEREGQPMPERLRAKLRSLPWMTDELLADCERPL